MPIRSIRRFSSYGSSCRHRTFARVSEIVARRGRHLTPAATDVAIRKWLYLQLRAAYLARDELSDPLGVGESSYADFDYPSRVARFVRYMPVQPGDVPGNDAIVARWSTFLDSELACLRASDEPA